MTRKEIEVGGTYQAKVAGRLTTVRIVKEHGTIVHFHALSAPTERHGGWDAINTATKRQVHIRSAARLRKRVDADRLTMIREARSAGANYEDARAWVDSNEQRLQDIAADIRATIETSI
jgi:hypothetical protein